MHKYFIKTPWIAKKFFSSYIWSLPTDDHSVFLTFDDGPHPTITPWVLEELKKHQALATFFCTGQNVDKYPSIYDAVLKDGHATGNHTYHHLNGWKTADKKYIDDIEQAARLIGSNLFRPPYGRIKNSQAAKISSMKSLQPARIVMWDVLSADFDREFTPEQCLSHVVTNVTPGSIVVFHDSEKAFVNLKYVLPRTLMSLKEKGYTCKRIEL